MVFQNHALYPHMSVFENMAYALKIRKVGNDGWEVRTETVELRSAERLIYGRIGGEQLIVRVEENQPAPVSDQVIRPREGRLHWFDAASGKRIAA